MTKAHFKCVNHLGINPVRHPVYTSGSWDITETEAKRLVGGSIYFHETKAEPSYFGGTVVGYDVIDTENAHSKRIVFKLESRQDCRNVAWDGADHTYAHYSGILD